jgi:hypothetical protein
MIAMERIEDVLPSRRHRLLPTAQAWLASQLVERSAFCTLTYKQGRQAPGGFVWLSREIMESQTKWLLMRLDRALLGRKKNRDRLLRCVVHEGDGRTKRCHTHFVVRLPRGVTEGDVKSLIEKIWAHSDWGRPMNDAKECWDIARLIKYLTKEGLDALDPLNCEFELRPNENQQKVEEVS